MLKSVQNVVGKGKECVESSKDPLLLLGGLLVRIRGGILSVRGGSLGSGGGCSIFGTGGKPRLQPETLT